MGHGNYLNEPSYHHHSSSSPSSSPASSPPSISPPGSSSSVTSPKLVATFKLPKTCTTCGKAIKTQGKVCAKCKMRKYRERKKEQEHSLKVQMKTYREQEEALKARIRQLEEDLHRRGSLEATPAAPTQRRSQSFSNDSRASAIERKRDGLEIERSSSAHREKILAQQQEVLRQQQEIISIQQSVIAQQQHVIDQHNLGHLIPPASSQLLHLRHPILDHNSAAAVAALAALSDDTRPSTSRQLATPYYLPQPRYPSPSTSPSPSIDLAAPRFLHRPSPQQPLLPPLEPERRQDGAPTASPNSNNNRMAITHLLSPTSAEMCAVSCI